MTISQSGPVPQGAQAGQSVWSPPLELFIASPTGCAARSGVCNFVKGFGPVRRRLVAPSRSKTGPAHATSRKLAMPNPIRSSIQIRIGTLIGQPWRQRGGRPDGSRPYSGLPSADRQPLGAHPPPTHAANQPFARRHGQNRQHLQRTESASASAFSTPKSNLFRMGSCCRFGGRHRKKRHANSVMPPTNGQTTNTRGALNPGIWRYQRGGPYRSQAAFQSKK